MPLTDTLRILQERLRFALLASEQALRRFTHWGLRLSLVVLAFTGEWITHLDSPGASNLVSIPALRGLHALAGMILLGVLLVLGLNFMSRLGRVWRSRRNGRGQSLQAWWSHRVPGQQGSPLRMWMNGGFAVLVGLLVLSGLERFWQVRYGGSVLPLLSPFSWYALHRLIPFYLYALLMFLSFNWGRMLLKRILRYLYAP
ncbi:MAG: cytochrome b/b6 domain-containing protein [Deltaproteobacteria bacterium]|nr:cytochrome b/b6 domain-containing protein [Deltaproteobacteria bacterium]